MAGWLLYAPAMRAPFVFDDIDNIANNTFIRLTHITAAELKTILNSPSPRPFANLTFAVNYYVHQYDIFGYHLINITIHIINALLVFAVAWLTLGLCGLQKNRIALSSALLWLVNPVHTQSVTYIVQRMNSLAAMFFLLAMVCYIRSRLIMRGGGASRLRPSIGFIACALAGILGLLSKQIVVILPVTIFLYEWYFFQDLNYGWFKKQTRWIIAVFLFLAVIALIYLKGKPLTQLNAIYARNDFTPGQRLLTQPQVILYYLTLLFFPHPSRLNLDYHFPVADSLIHPATTPAAFLALLALIGIAVYTARNHRLFSFAILWFLVTLAIESSFIGLAMIFEHRTYLPSVFPIIAAVYFAGRRAKPRIGALVIMAAIVTWGYGTYQRNRVWSNEKLFWADAAAKTPRSPRVLNNLGMAYRQNGQIAAAEKAFRDALSYDPEAKDALNNLGTILLDKNEIDEALALFDRAIITEPDYYDAHYNRGLALLKSGRIIEATRAFSETIRLNPFSEKAHNNLGAALMRQLEVDKAVFHFQRALTLDPSFMEAYNNLGIAYFKKGLPEQALGWFNKALDIDPFYVEAYDNMKRINFLLDEHGKALSRLRQNLGRQPDSPVLYFRLAELYEKSGMVALALDYYKKSLALQPDAVTCLNNLGNLYAIHYQDQPALAIFHRLASILPESPKLHYNLACLYARQGQTDEALRHLETAIQNGYDNWRQIASDKDLENIRGTEYFKKIIINLQREKEHQ